MARQLRVLLVDDEPAILGMLGRALIWEGYDVSYASDGKSACEVLKSKGFDLVVTDLHMRPVDGFAVLRRAKKRNPTTSVFVMSGDGNSIVASESLRLGADDFLSKPFDLKELLQRFASLHSQLETVPQGVDVN